jgi:hypothetical protein
MEHHWFLYSGSKTASFILSIKEFKKKQFGIQIVSDDEPLVTYWVILYWII